MGVAALDGPYDLSGTMRNLALTADANFTAPYFLPYLVSGYGSVYGSSVPSMSFNNAVVSTPLQGTVPFNQKLYSMLSGAYTPEAIGSLMKQVTPYNGPRSVLMDQYTNALGNTNSGLCQALQENDACRGWLPLSPTEVLLYHNPDDDLVPFGNYNAAKVWWGTQTHITYQSSSTVIPGLGSVHAGTMIPAYLRAATWVHGLN